jgi:hypothetical protein
MNRLLAIISITILLVASCGKKERIVEVPVHEDCPDCPDCPPSAPAGVYSINQGTTVVICWYANPEDDVAGYDVYRGVSFYGDYDYIGTVEANSSGADQYCFEDTETDVGQQFYYAVVAYDEGGLQSDLSYEEVTGTPRPEGEATLFAFNDRPGECGFDLSNPVGPALAYDDPNTDFYLRITTEPGREAAQFVCHRVGVDIQDFGYKDSFESVNWAPTSGWAAARIAETVMNHCYILRLLEADGKFHYAKLYVEELTGSFVTFRWAYQTAPNNRDLAPPAPGRGPGSGPSASDGAKPGLNTDAKLAIDSTIPPIVDRVTSTRDFELTQQTAL